MKLRIPTIRKSLPVLGLVGHLTVERQGEAAEKYGRYTGEHEVYFGPLTVYWSAPAESLGLGSGPRRQVIVSYYNRWPYFSLSVDTFAKVRIDR